MLVVIAPTMSFASLKQGTRARVVSIREHSGLERLIEMGLTVGAEFQVEKVAPLGDTVEISLRGYSLCLRKAEAEPIEVQILD